MVLRATQTVLYHIVEMAVKGSNNTDLSFCPQRSQMRMNIWSSAVRCEVVGSFLDEFLVLFRILKLHLNKCHRQLMP